MKALIAMNMTTHKEQFTTSDLALATVLSLYLPIELVDRTDTRRVEFVFNSSEELHKLTEAFWKGELAIEPKLFFTQLRIIKSRIYDK